MKNLVESILFKVIILNIILVGNIAFYTWGYPDSGAQYAWDIHPLFWGMLQGLFCYAAGAYMYFAIKKV